jgi:hypothetical protein
LVWLKTTGLGALEPLKKELNALTRIKDLIAQLDPRRRCFFSPLSRQRHQRLAELGCKLFRREIAIEDAVQVHAADDNARANIKTIAISNRSGPPKGPDSDEQSQSIAEKASPQVTP